MTIKDRLLRSGAIIDSKESDFGQYRKEVEVWFKKDSQALREFVSRLTCQYPEVDMRCYCRPHPVSHGKTIASLWSSEIFEPYICISLDMEDCPEYGARWRMPLISLLADIQEQGVKDAMAFRVTMDYETWQRLIGFTEHETLPSA